jgi:hypothetical protein
MAVRTSATTHNYFRTVSLGSQTKCSMTCWVKITVDLNNNTAAWLLTNTAGTDYLGLFTDVNGTTMDLFDSGSVAATGPNMTVGTWYFLGVSWDASAVILTSRALGASSFTTATSALGSATHVFDKLILSNTVENDPGGLYLNGCIAAVKGWVGTGLTAAQLQSEAWSYVPKYPNPTFFYPMLTTSTVDYSGNGHTLSGGTGATTEDGPGVGWGPRRSGLLVRDAVVTHDLVSAGLAASSGAADARTFYPLASAGLAASSGAAAANLLMPLVSAGLAASSGTAVALVGATLASAGVAASAGTAALLTGVVLEGASLAASTAIASLTVGVVLGSAAAAASSGAADMLAAQLLESTGLATGAAAGALGLTMPLAGAGAATAAGTASAGVGAGLTAAGLATSTGEAAVAAQAVLSAAGLVSGTGTAALTGAHALAAAGAAAESGAATAVVGFVFVGLASSSGSAGLTLTITLGTTAALEASSADADLTLDMVFAGASRGTSTGRAVLYIALPYTPGPMGAIGRGPGGGAFGPSGRTRASGADTGRTRG